MNMSNMRSYADLCTLSYSGKAWNVFYEYENTSTGDIWGHSGEFADELDAWFLDLEDAQAFADTNYPFDHLQKMVDDAVDADRITVYIAEWYWEDGTAMYHDDDWFLIAEKHRP